MTRSTWTRRAAAATTLLAVLATALPVAAHSGHGHEGLSTWQGVLHALGEPDHLLMLAAGAAACTVAAPRLLRALGRLRDRLRARRAATTARPQP